MSTPQGTVWLKGIKVGTESASYNADGNREYEAVYIVDTSSGTIAAPVVVEAAGLPRLGQRYLHDYAARCKAIDPQRVANSQTLWHVRCRWEVEVGEDPDREGLKPWEWPPEPAWDAVPLEIASPVDLKGQSFEDAAGTPLNPPPPIPQSNQILTILRNEIGFSSKNARYYGNTINNKGWFGFPKYAVKLAMPTASGQWYNGQLYWQVVYRLEVMCGWAWDDKLKKQVQLLWEPYAVPNIGPMHIPDDGGEPVHNTDAFGDPDTIHRKLNDDGTLRARDEWTLWTPFTRFREADFSAYFRWLGG